VPAARAGLGEHSGQQPVAHVGVERAQQEDCPLPADDADQRLQRRLQVHVARPPRQRLERDRPGDRVLGVGGGQQRDVGLGRQQLDGALEDLVLAQGGSAPLLPRKRPQGLERFLELTHPSAASSS
jgi:hypothetical protein